MQTSNVSAPTNDRTIKEICESVLLREIDLHTLTLSSISMSAAAAGGGSRAGMLFTGSTGGRVQVSPFGILRL